MNQEEEKSFRKNILTILATEPINGIAGVNFCPQILGEDPSDQDYKDLANCMHYLEQHKLITVKWHNRSGVPFPLLSKITASGQDYISEDGGLTAELNTVTVKFDIDSTRELLASGLLSMGIPEAKKGILRQALEGATADTIKELVKSVLRNPQGAVEAAQNLLNVVF